MIRHQSLRMVSRTILMLALLISLGTSTVPSAAASSSEPPYIWIWWDYRGGGHDDRWAYIFPFAENPSQLGYSNSVYEVDLSKDPRPYQDPECYGGGISYTPTVTTTATGVRYRVTGINWYSGAHFHCVFRFDTDRLPVTVTARMSWKGTVLAQDTTTVPAK